MIASSRQDRPIESETADQLDRGPFIDSMIRALVVEERDKDGNTVGRKSSGFVVGLTGRWGLGKSSVVNLLEKRLRATDHAVVATFNPWLFSGRDELLRGFFNELRDAMGRSGKEHARDLRKAVDRYWAALEFAAHAGVTIATAYGWPGIPSALDWCKRAWKGLPKQTDRSPTDERRALERKLVATKTAVVVLIDELDRVEDGDVRAVAQLVKAVGDIRGVSYLVAYDPDRVVDALGRGEGEERRRTGELYLEKIVQHPIPLRPLFVDDVDVLLRAAITEAGSDLAPPKDEDEERILSLLKQDISTPREVKRLIGAYSVIEAAVRGEVAQYDVLGYSWILTKTPSLRDAIANDPDKVVDDPTGAEMAARVVWRLEDRNTTPRPQDVLGESAGSHVELLKLLFPIFDEDRTNVDEGARISRRRNLVRLLYLGNPPGMVRRIELERIWKLANVSAIERELRQLRETDRLPGTLDRLDDLLPDLTPDGDPFFGRASLALLFAQKTGLPHQTWETI